MARPQRPGKKRLQLVRQGLPKAHTQRTAAEKRAIRLTRAWRQAHPNWNKQGNKQGNQQAGLADPTHLLTPQQINDLAGQMAQGDILPQQQALEREQDQLAQSAHQQQALIGNLTQELGGLTAQIAPSIQTAYRQAANDQANFAQGFSGNMQDIASAEAARNAAQLAQLGAPAEQISGIQNQGQGAGNVLYGQGGYLPATSLGQQGAAFEAFGAQMPGVVARMGQQDVADSVANQAAAQKDLAGRAADIAAQLPSLRRQYVETLLGNERDKASLQLAMQELGLKAQSTAADIAATINPDTGRPYGVDANGNPIPDPGSEGLSPSEIRQRQKAANDYQEGMGSAMTDTLKSFIDERRKPGTAAVGFPGTSGFIPEKPDETDAQVKVRISYKRAFQAIYSQLASSYGKGNKKWKFGWTDAKVRQMIRKFLVGQGIKAPAVAPPWAPPRNAPGYIPPSHGGPA